ncbi:ribosomal-protein-alanine N-acetyltransferase [Evansella caseinilytica]|uniref:Ribosomal-protein-alanine N-acetyltransferase n=1 Tax=Evansella caseinilytica TaxID=1503961 RepID=A0A1H3SU81_9BACI|nr:GNAT family protein [Evansella caseinilytica]SDZ41556.1 ribosomal-protein-alanine N-acetyltransferase [Evansella caseinilytica]
MEIEEIYGSLPELETKRLRLRKITAEDAEEIFYYASKEEVAKYVTWNTHRSLTDTKAFVSFVLDQYDQGKIAPWGIEIKQNGSFIGTIDFVWWKPLHHSAEIGYVLSHDYWGKGIMAEAVGKLLSFGFEKMDLVRIQARCFVENIGSQRVMEKAGMSYEGLIRKGLFVKGKHRDLLMYSIIKEEFQALKERNHRSI